jgi:hypothetical protein
MSLVISKVFTYDTDAGDYIQRVEGASGDNQALEPATRQAINNFVIGCKQDGIWNAIKASCILSGARTLNGALQPLAGTAPTNFNFVSGDYNRKTGLIGNGSSKYLNSNRNNNADPQNSKHLAVWAATSGTNTGTYNSYIGALPENGVGRSDIEMANSSATINFYANSNNIVTARTLSGATGLYAVSRNDSSNHNTRLGAVSVVNTAASATPFNGNIFIFARNLNNSGTFSQHSNARLAFYSIGESLDLALLDARVTALITAFGVAIP